MSCFDTIHLTCPHCGERTDIQTKAGKCELLDYTQESVPMVLAAREQQYPHKCNYCEKRYFLLCNAPLRTQVTGVKDWHEGVDTEYEEEV